MDVGTTPQPESNHPCADSMIVESVDNNEAAGPAVLLVRIERHWGVGRKVAERDIVKAKRISSKVITVFTSILCLILVIVSGVVLVPKRPRYDRPGMSCTLLIQRRCAAN